MEEPRFVADRALGRLARWLRLLGFDTAYRPELTGEKLLAFAAREGRVLLTRDRLLGRRLGRDRVLRLASADFRGQLREIDEDVPLGGARPARCAACNGRPEPVDDASPDPHRRAEERVDLRRCPSCGRLLWAGPHQRSVASEIAKLGLRPRPESPTIR